MPSFETFTVLFIRFFDLTLRVPTLRYPVLIAEVGLAALIEAIVGRQETNGSVGIASSHQRNFSLHFM